MNYYNEFDPKAAAWLRELIRAGLIPAGDVDERSITEIKPYELSGYTQCHFFAGIGGWPLALEFAGWPSTRPIWTGSCPCQPFSLGNVNAGGLSDARHLWPVFSELTRVCRPSTVAGEQVDDAIPEGWLDEVFGDLEVEGYACGAAVLPARGYGAEHWRDRLFWVAHSGSEGRQGRQPIDSIPCGSRQALTKHGDPLAHSRRALEGDWANIPIGDGLSVGMVRSILKGAGNAIVPQVAAEFVSAFIETGKPSYPQNGYLT